LWEGRWGIIEDSTRFLFDLTLLVGRQEGHPACKNGGWWRWALVSPEGVATSRMVGVSASVHLPLHHKVQKFSSGTGSPGWSRKKGRKTVVVWWLKSKNASFMSTDLKKQHTSGFVFACLN